MESQANICWNTLENSFDTFNVNIGFFIQTAWKRKYLKNDFTNRELNYRLRVVVYKKEVGCVIFRKGDCDMTQTPT